MLSYFEDFPRYVHLLSAAVSALIDRLTLLPTGHNVEMLSFTPSLPTLPTNTNITHTWQYYYLCSLILLLLVVLILCINVSMLLMLLLGVVDIDVLMLMKLVDTMCHIRQCSSVCEQFAVFRL